ncbi:MAG: taurine dioxygenase, partial [Rhodospirillaceae bacterium]|nr:taurine dioxygenase [Rhodospirillaceae bacterium]
MTGKAWSMPATFDIEPIGPTIGAEIHGLDLSRQIDQETASALEAAMVEHKVIYARDQHITTAQHVAFGRMFGELEVHPFRPEGEFPEIMVLDNHKDNPVLSTDVWHSDTTFRDCPTRYS